MATNKRFPRIRAHLRKSAASAALALATAVATMVPAGRLRASDWMPLLPDQDFYDFQLFAPPDLGNYNMFRREDDGIYFNYDRLYWGITIPRTVPVATTPEGLNIIPSQPISPFTVADLNNDYLEFAETNPIIVNQTTDAVTTTTSLENISSNTTIFEIGSDPLRLDLNTSWMRTKMTWGNRYEGGWSYGGRGIHISYFQVGKQEQSFGTSNEFAVNSPTQTFTFENNVSGGGAGAGAGGGGGTGGSSQINVSLETTTDSPQPDHLITQNLLQKNATEMQSAGVAMTLRRNLGRERGATQATFSLGPRFVQIADRYELDYASFQNTFNATGGGGQQQGGQQQGGQQQGGQQQGGQQQGGQQRAASRAKSPGPPATSTSRQASVVPDNWVLRREICHQRSRVRGRAHFFRPLSGRPTPQIIWRVQSSDSCLKAARAAGIGMLAVPSPPDSTGRTTSTKGPTCRRVWGQIICEPTSPEAV